MGHVSFNCPTRGRPEMSTQRSDAQRADTQRSGVQRNETQRGDRPTTAGRVFALTGAEASTSSDLVKGKGKAAGEGVMLLFDSGDSHSFISYACVAMLGVPVSDLGLRLLVSTPASASVVTSELCAGCPIVVNGKKYKQTVEMEEWYSLHTAYASRSKARELCLCDELQLMRHGSISLTEYGKKFRTICD
ncbi:uncharacterized protein LOC109815702 [Cajanus cajan]|uniref:uncharacterized protein LOC109815702 n=1 Tax=Cajanus cajan TaxID=3821 RepID=UPI00098DCA3D|nr:uncharacterized protein LOC109815702 [Cajanus cajan]